jgi:hypothetical protein
MAKHKLRWYQFTLRSLLVVVAAWAVVCTCISPIIRTWQSMHVQTVCVRLTSSGMVQWGNNLVTISMLQPDLKKSANAWRSYKWRPRLLIECYSDARESDIAKLETVGRDVGFDIVDRACLTWPSPDWAKTPP